MKKTTEPVVVRIFYELEALHSVSSILLIRKMSRRNILDIDLDFWNKIWEIHIVKFIGKEQTQKPQKISIFLP